MPVTLIVWLASEAAARPDVPVPSVWKLSCTVPDFVDGALLVPTTRTVQGTSPIAIDGVFTPVDLSANRVFSLLVAGQQDEDVIVRKAGAWTRLAKGANDTYLGVSGGVVGYIAGDGATPVVAPVDGREVPPEPGPHRDVPVTEGEDGVPIVEVGAEAVALGNG